MEPETKDRRLERQYTVFISYRHADNIEEGRQWATWLHRELESYLIPPDLVGVCSQNEYVIPASLYPVFRDEEELPAGADLSENIQQALSNSRMLVVICSPRTLESRHVADEIRYFKELGKGERILALMIDGEPNASDDAGKLKSGFTPNQECLPDTLRFGKTMPDNRIDWSQRKEPIAADIRPEGRPEQGWTSGAYYKKALTASGGLDAEQIARKVADYEARLKNAKLKIIAGCLGIPLGVLTRRDKVRELREARRSAQVLRRWVTALGALAALAAVGGFFAWNQHRLAVREHSVAIGQHNEALKQASQSGQETAEEKMQADNPLVALPYLAASLRNNPTNFVAASRLASILRTWNCPVSRVALDQKGMYSQAIFSPDSKSILVINGRQAEIHDILTGELLGTPFRHETDVDCSGFSPDGKFVATASRDGTARIWNAQSGESVGDPLRHSGPVNTVEFSPNGERLATASDDKTARIWDAHTGKPMGAVMQHAESVFYAGFSPDGKRIVTASADRKAQIWDAETGIAIGQPIQHGSEFTIKPVISPNGKWLLTATPEASGRTYAVHVTDIETGKPVGKPIVFRDQISFASFSPEGTWVLAASLDKTARVTDILTGNPVGSVLHQAGKIFSAGFSPDQLWVVTGGDDKTVQVWETPSPVPKPIGAKMYHPGNVFSTQFSPDGKWILTLSSDHMARVWPLPSVPASADPLPHPEGVFNARFTPDGKRVITTPLKSLQMWDATTSKPVGTTYHGDSDFLNPKFLPDGKRILVQGSKTAQIFDAQTLAPLTKPMSHDAGITYTDCSADSKLILTSGWDGTVAIWDSVTGAATGERLHEKNTGYITRAIFSPNAKWILTLSSNALQVWNVASRKSVIKMPVNYFGEFTRDSKRFLTINHGKLNYWDVPSGKPDGEIILKDCDASGGMLSPDGLCFVSNVSGTSLRIWDLVTGNPIGEPMHHTDRITSREFSPDGNWIVSSSQDKTTCLWSAWTGKRVAVDPFKYRLGVSSASFSPDGRHVVSSSWDKLAHVWDLDTVNQPAPAWLMDWAEAVAGGRLNGDHLEPLDANLVELRKKLAGLKGQDDLSKLGRWFAADHFTRTITPSSTETVPEYVAEMVKENTLYSLVNAYTIDPCDPLVLAALTRFDPNREHRLFYFRHALKCARLDGRPELVGKVNAFASGLFPELAEFR